MTITKEWVGVPAVAPHDPPPKREDVCHTGGEEEFPGLYRTYCGKLVAEPHCCHAPGKDCGRPVCLECATRAGRPV